MQNAAKNNSLSPVSLAVVRVLLLLVVALCLGQTRVWGFEITPQPASGVFESVTPSSTGENYDDCPYDASDSLLAAEGGGFKPGDILPDGRIAGMGPGAALNNQAAREAAKALKFKPVNGAPFNSHGQPVFKKGNRYLTPDVDQHSGGVWKMFDQKGRRLGTYDGNLNRIGK